MMLNRYFRPALGLCLAALLYAACQPGAAGDYKAEAENPEAYHTALTELTDVIVHDIFSPPVASRIYAYASIAGYEAMQPFHAEGYRSLAGQLNGLDALPQPDTSLEYCAPLVGVVAFLETGKAFIFSEDTLAEVQARLLRRFRDTIGVPKAVYERSVAQGQAVSKAVLAWSKKDNYAQTRSAPKFSIGDEPGRWQPTPPAYMDGIEPSWALIRPFTLDSAQQYRPAPPTPFSSEPGSPFFQEMMEVHDVGKGLTTEQRAIASFWDCNPYVMQLEGHAMFATKKITPGGHWMGIAYIANRQAQADPMRSAEAYALTAIALADGFISCWDEKYRSNLIRPETVIQRYVDKTWKPLLQTPPFPEYTSGHSVISTAAAVVLTQLYGDSFAFADDTEEAFGLPMRRFPSFLAASQEAAISRLYGGIHYRPAIENGMAQGRAVGSHVLARIQTRPAPPQTGLR